MATIAIHDRLFHKAHIIIIDGNSYRLKNYNKMMKEVEKNACSEPLPSGSVGNSVSLTKSGSNLVLNFDAPGGGCIAQNYSIYRGTLQWTSYDYAPLTCSANGTSFIFPNGNGNYYYVVVPQGSGREGSYDADSSGSERLPSITPLPSLNFSDPAYDVSLLFDFHFRFM